MSKADWQLNCTQVKQRLTYLLEFEKLSDCAFRVGTEQHQVLVRGHKSILAMASPVFEAMFYGELAERTDPILVLDVQLEAFKALLKYIYTDKIDINSIDNACQLYYSAKKYMLPQLVEECIKYLLAEIGPKNACRTYEFAKFYEESILMEKCIEIMYTQTKDVIEDSSFDEVEFEVMMLVLSLNRLAIDSELDLFNAVERYAIAHGLDKSEGVKNEPSTYKTSKDMVKKQCDAINTTSSELSVAMCAGDNSSIPLSRPDHSTQSGNPKDTGLKKQEKLSIRRALELIRFLTLTPQEFTQGPALSSLLTESESYAILTNLVSDSTEVAMPTGFSRCKEIRSFSCDDDCECRSCTCSFCDSDGSNDRLGYCRHCRNNYKICGDCNNNFKSFGDCDYKYNCGYCGCGY